MSGDLLEVTGLRLAYGSRVVVDGCSFSVRDGECVALVGANGAGKSTVLKSLVGIHRVADGTVRFAGKDVTRWPPAQAVSSGMVLCPEGRHLFPEMSVRDNLLLGTAAAGIGRREARARVAEVEERFPKLRERTDQLAGTLSGGEQQMVALGRALVSRPRLLVLDEPTLGLAPLMVEVVFELIEAVIGDGTSVLIAEQNVNATLDAADRAYVIETGRIVHDGTADELRCRPGLTAELMGI
ncbi:ABC transporter ATP-binding protein [Streptomyces sp. NPDC005708]|uniref:ABC transporter ATP-binding protein n=1 Tax=Streptomyces sp. NPDC005708 TaxID=3154564 RepID=UPI0033CBB11C